MPTPDFQLLQDYLSFKLFAFSPLANGLDFYNTSPTDTALAVDARGYSVILQVAAALGRISAQFSLQPAYEHEVSLAEMVKPDALPDLVTFTIYRWNVAELARFLPIMHDFQAAQASSERYAPVKFYLPATSSASPAPSHKRSFDPQTRRALADRPWNSHHHWPHQQ